MQKKYCKVLSCLALLMSWIAYADHSCCVSHQFVPRSITTDLAYTNMLNYYERHHNEHSKFIYSGNFIYQKSRKSSELGSAFLLNKGNCVDVSQNSLGANPPTDINSFWLGLVNTDPNNPFASRFCVEPERRLFAYYNYFYGDLSDWVCGLWADVAFAVLATANRLNCCEEGNQATGPCASVAGRIVAASLDNEALLHFGKFNCDGCGDKHRAGVDDVQVRVGYERSWCNDRHIWGVYAIGTIPTGRRLSNAFIFEPVAGSRHGSFGVGVNADYQLWCDSCDSNLALLFDANYRYAFKRNECRSFDLCKNGAFSRHLLVVTQDAPSTPMPGINFFTQNVEVIPQSTVQAWLALHYERCDWDVELGYNFFWRQQEKIPCFDGLPANLGIYQLGCKTGCTTASTAVISQGPNQITRDAEFVALTAQELNLQSGAAARALSNKFYGAVSKEGDLCNCLDWHVALGGSYEFVTGNYRCSTLPYWGVFGQFSLLY